MPPFVLEKAHPEKERDIRNLRIIYTKGTYSPKVQITDWQNEKEEHPKDNDPYIPNHINLHLASYNKLGTDPDQPYISTSQAALQEAIDLKHDYEIPNTNRYLVNYYTFHDIGPCDSKDDKKESYCPVCINNYDTTMQVSYAPPHPFIMKRVSFPKIPFERFRKFKWASPEFSDTKFWDDRLLEHICRNQNRSEIKAGYVKKINEL